ncbi:MAG: SH3 domain-containing protein [Pseudodonghicola sp.]
MFRKVLAPLTLAAAVALTAGAAHADSYRYVREGVNLNARSGPGAGYAARRVLAPGTRITLVQQIGNWAQVRTPEGLLLWVFGAYLMDQASQGKAPVAHPVATQPQPKPQPQPQPKASQPQQQQQQQQQQQRQQTQPVQPPAQPQPRQQQSKQQGQTPAQQPGQQPGQPRKPAN